MAIQLDFSNAEEQRLKITQEQQEYIRDLYRQASAEVGKLAEQAPRVPSDALRQQYLHTLQGQIDAQLRNIERQLNGTIKSGMTDTAKATVADAKAFLKEAGLPIKGAYSHVPADIVRSVASGQLYTGNWTLSRALWLNTAETQKDVQSVIAQGIIQNKSAYDIAKDLEKYVDPTARKDWDWSKVYPGTKKVVDYNAQRLARTMVSHAYQQAFVRTTQKNPFVSKYKWEASNSGRVCEICEERDGKLFDKDDLPLDHPNGMCTFTAVTEDLDKIGERLGDWAAGKSDPELDKWAEDLYGKSWEQKKEEVKTKDQKVTVRDAKWVDSNFKNLKSKVTEKYGKKTWDSLASDIASKPPHIQDWIQRFTGRIGFGTDGDKAYYRLGTIVEQMTKDATGNRGRDPFSTFYHELGHYIDIQGKGTHGVVSGSSAGEQFLRLLNREYKSMLTSTGSLDPDIRKALRANDNTSGVQDAISGLSMNRNRVKWGHDTSYWTRKKLQDQWKEITSETFANMNAAYCMPGSDAEKAFQQYFPESYEYFKTTWVENPKAFYKKA